MHSKATDTDHRTFIPTTTPGVYKRGGSYVVRFRDGHGIQRSRTCRTLAEARRVRSEVNADVSRGEYRPDTKLTFAEYAETWKETYAGRTSRGLRPETLDEYRRDLNRATLYLGRRRLAEIDAPTVKAYARSLANAGLKPGTVRRILAPLKACLATAVEDGHLRHNPIAGVRLAVATPKVVDGSEVEEDDTDEVKALTTEQLAELVAQVGDGWHGLIVRLMAQSGIRIGEALGLRWQDVDSAAGRIRIRRRVRRGKVGKPKSQSGTREVPVAPKLLRELTAHRLASPYSDSTDLVFPTDTGKPCHASNLYRWLKPAAKAAGVEWAAFHTLRHTAASRWLVSGIGIAQVSKLLGHHDPGFTLRTYIHVLPSDLPAGDELAAAVGMG